MMSIVFDSMNSGLQFLCLLQLLFFIKSCPGQGHGGGRSGGGSWGGSRRGGRGYAIFSGRGGSGGGGQSSSYGDDENIYAYLEPIIIILFVLLCIALLVLVWKWAGFCHKLINHPEKLEKKDPDQLQREVVARYQALQNKFREDLQRQQAERNGVTSTGGVSTVGGIINSGGGMSTIYPIQNYENQGQPGQPGWIVVEDGKGGCQPSEVPMS